MRRQITPSGQVRGAGPMPLVGIPASVVFGPTAAAIGGPQIIPLQPVAAQQFSITLNNQACQIKLAFKALQVPVYSAIPTEPPLYAPGVFGFFDLYVSDALIIAGVLCRDRDLIVRDRYLGFVGDFAFIDRHGVEDPQPGGLGSRWLLSYWPELP